MVRWTTHFCYLFLSHRSVIILFESFVKTGSAALLSPFFCLMFTNSTLFELFTPTLVAFFSERGAL